MAGAVSHATTPTGTMPPGAILPRDPAQVKTTKQQRGGAPRVLPLVVSTTRDGKPAAPSLPRTGIPGTPCGNRAPMDSARVRGNQERQTHPFPRIHLWDRRVPSPHVPGVGSSPCTPTRPGPFPGVSDATLSPNAHHRADKPAHRRIGRHHRTHRRRGEEKGMAALVGFEPTSQRFRGVCSTAELQGRTHHIATPDKKKSPAPMVQGLFLIPLTHPSRPWPVFPRAG